MAEFEGKLNLNVETSELEVNGKFSLTEEELDLVAGGSNEKQRGTIDYELMRKLLGIIFAPISDSDAARNAQ